jgi:hypothetical protein
MNFLIADVAVIVAVIACVVLLLFFVIRITHPGRRRRTNHQHIPACYSQPPAETEIEIRK